LVKGKRHFCPKGKKERESGSASDALLNCRERKKKSRDWCAKRRNVVAFEGGKKKRRSCEWKVILEVGNIAKQLGGSLIRGKKEIALRRGGGGGRHLQLKKTFW